MVELEGECCAGVGRPGVGGTLGAAEALLSHSLLFRQRENGKSKSQNFSGWKRSLGITQSNTHAMAQSPRPGYTQTCPAGFDCLDTEAPSPLWMAFSPLNVKKFFFMLRWSLCFRLWPLLLILTPGTTEKSGTITLTPAFEALLCIEIKCWCQPGSIPPWRILLYPSSRCQR